MSEAQHVLAAFCSFQNNRLNTIVSGIFGSSLLCQLLMWLLIFRKTSA